jgi:hypothetical protein
MRSRQLSLSGRSENKPETGLERAVGLNRSNLRSVRLKKLAQLGLNVRAGSFNTERVPFRPPQAIANDQGRIYGKFMPRQHVADNSITSKLLMRIWRFANDCGRSI